MLLLTSARSSLVSRYSPLCLCTVQVKTSQVKFKSSITFPQLARAAPFATAVWRSKQACACLDTCVVSTKIACLRHVSHQPTKRAGPAGTKRRSRLSTFMAYIAHPRRQRPQTGVSFMNTVAGSLTSLFGRCCVYASNPRIDAILTRLRGLRDEGPLPRGRASVTRRSAPLIRIVTDPHQTPDASGYAGTPANPVGSQLPG